MEEIQSASHRSTNKKVFKIITREECLNKHILDIGAGRGYMASLIGKHVIGKGGDPASVITACDLFPEYFQYKDIKCEKMDFIDKLPFADESFDIAYSIEVIEHLKNPYEFISEMCRVVRPGGKIIITTPNILNLSSRISYLFTGFFELFRPLSSNPEDARRQWGHIMPLSAYYLNHSMKVCGLKTIELHVDRLKRSSLFLYLPLLPVLKVSSMKFMQRLKRKKPDIYMDNEQDLKLINGWKLCCSRSVILIGYK